ncbi:unnamed protein product, partial [Candidula unifasciata]
SYLEPFFEPNETESFLPPSPRFSFLNLLFLPDITSTWLVLASPPETIMSA